MMYRTSKNGMVSVVIETLDSKAITNMNIIVDSNKNNLRKRVGYFIREQVKKMKPDEQMLSWKTSIGDFTIYKEASLDYCFEPNKSKYNTISTKLEYNPKKGKIRNIVIKSRKFVNKEYEGFDECPNCFEKGLLDYTIKRQDNVELSVCKKCKDFDKLLDKLAKQIDEKKKSRKTVQTSCSAENQS